MSTCHIPNCTGTHKAFGLCTRHYQRQRAGLPLEWETEPVIRNSQRVCSVEGCERPYRCKGLCAKHYDRSRTNRPLDAVDPVPEDPSTWNHNPTAEGYILLQARIGGRRYKILEHRYVMEQHLGRSLLEEENIHHKNGMRGDNRLDNLELWNTAQPAGQRVEDKLDWARHIIELYG